MNWQKHIETLWQELHKIPEPAFQEIRTTTFCAKVLKEAGYTVHSQVIKNQTGLVAVLDSGKPGPVVGLRSDMDCLLFSDHKQMVGIHACGHDAHMAIILTAAEKLAQTRLKKGKLKIILQPAEEIGLGAKAMLATGLLDDLDYLFGLHVMPQTLAASGQVIAQINWTACHLITAELTGRTAHASLPHLGINAINAGCAVVTAVNALQLAPLENWNVKATRFETGSGALNAICDKVTVGFDLRTTKNSVMDELRTKVISTIKATAKSCGTKVKVKIVGTCPASEPDPYLQETMKQSITQEVGTKGLIPEVSTTIGEDFNFYKQYLPRLKTGFIGLGCDLTPGLHDRNMHFKHDQLIHGVNILTDLASKALMA